MLAIDSAPGRLVDAAAVDRNSPRSLLQYAAGTLLYTPGNHPTIGRDICEQRYRHLRALCLCLEDAVSDRCLPQAEEKLFETLEQLYAACSRGVLQPEELPLLFIRVRTPGHLLQLSARLGLCRELLTGFALPKFEASCSRQYAEALAQVNGGGAPPLYMLPILESAPLLALATRQAELEAVRRTLCGVREWVLHIRIGGNDLSNLFAVRRRIDETIYDNLVLADFLKDTLLALGMEFPLSAPVWEYFGPVADCRWQEGLQRELRLDILNGFVGKTAVHPAQLPVIRECLAVDEADYADAAAICQWDRDAAVAKGEVYTRMNEQRVHIRWAHKVMALAEIYGTRKRSG